MPMYQRKPIELRLAIEDNVADIAQWAEMDECDVMLGYYYDMDGWRYSQYEVETYFDEIE